MEVTFSFLVEGGRASGGPPIGPALGPLGINVNEIINEINKRTKEFEGIQVPIKITINKETKKYSIDIGLPPVSSLIKKEIGIEKGSGTKDYVGNITLEKVIKIAKMKGGKNLKGAVLSVIGTCKSMGVTVEGEDPKIITKKIKKGLYDEIIK
ncbi:MAG: 50S ribosomal protein L11 [Candidatus Micrarchaeia archaeon]